jgi:pimeloyl-ACP methyl ester carboxylesterase/transcriptional regulator with XRE-family HTH domain
MAHHRPARPYWSQVLRALREARGITQDGWAMQIGYGRATVKRWEAGETVPSADAEAKIISLCHERALFRPFKVGPLAGVRVTPDWLSDLLASARLEHASSQPHSTAQSTSYANTTTQYALSNDVAIAYQVFGAGPIDLVVTPGLVSHRELEWEHQRFAELLNRFASVGRVAIFDKRGTGMSDRVAAGTLEERMDDIRAVMDAAGMQRAVLVGVSEGGPLSILFAATYPERTQALVLYGAFACEWHPELHPLGKPLAPIEDRVRQIRGSWGKNATGFLQMFAPSVADDPAEQKWWARYCRISASPGAAATLITMNSEIDVRHVLPAIKVPTLVLHRRGDRATEVEYGQYLARHIPGARYIEMDGNDHLPMYGNLDQLIGEIRTFVNDVHTRPEVDSVLTTVLTLEMQVPFARCANEESILLDTFQNLADYEFKRYRGEMIHYTESQRVAHFDGPSRAVHCACEIVTAAASQGIDARAGLHTGEMQRCGDQITGSPIIISGEICEIAVDSEVLLSRTVRDLIAGSGLVFEDRGTYELPPAPDELALFRVDTA